MAKKNKPKSKDTIIQKAWKESTSMPMVNIPPSLAGETNFAKDEKKK